MTTNANIVLTFVPSIYTLLKKEKCEYDDYR